MGRYVRIANEIFEQYGERIGCVGIALYGLLLKYADASTGECFPSLVTVGKTLGISKPTALKYLAKLEECGLVVRINRKTEKGTQESNLYRVKNFDSDTEEEPAPWLDRVKNFDEPGKEFSQNRVKNLYPNYPQGELTPDVPPPPPLREITGQAFEDAQRFFSQHLGALEEALGTIGGGAKKELIDIFESYYRRGKPPTLAHLHFARDDARAYNHTAGTVSLAHWITGLSKAIDPRPKAPTNGQQHHPRSQQSAARSPARGGGGSVSEEQLREWNEDRNGKYR